MRTIKKRGISPLIATVLLIGFVVAAAAVVMLWTRGFVGELQEKRCAEGAAKFSCSTDVEIGLRDASFGSGKVNAVVENKRQKIDGFILVVHGPAGTDSIESTSGIEAGGIGNLELDYDNTKTGGVPQSLDVIPRLKLGRGVYQPCPDQKLTWNFKI